jgi:hypothetical protein
MQKELYDEIRFIVREETIYLRHYIAQIVDVNDIMNRGRVKVVIPELGFDTPDKGTWCFPRQGRSLIVPSVGEWVEVYFLSGNNSRPVYLFPISEIPDMIPPKYTGETTKSVLFQDKQNNTDNILYDQLQKILTIFEGTEPFVLGNQIQTFLTSLVNALNTHTHTGVTVGGGITGVPGAPFSSPSGLLSSNIKGK